MIRQISLFITTRWSTAIIFLIFTTLTSCKRSEYNDLVKAEIEKNIVNDELFFGLKLGKPRQHFYDICWQLNKDKKVKQGPKNSYVEYKLPLKDSTRTVDQITMLFYGIFDEKKIMTGLDLKFYYDAWSLWNESYTSEKLVPVVKDTLLTWFPGNDFIPMKSDESSEQTWVKVDGTRQIVIEPLKDTREVDVRIDDLRFSKGITQ